MFEPNLSIDVSLLGIILGLHATKNDKNLILVLLCVLFAHILLTNDDDGEDGLAVSEQDGSKDEGDSEESRIENIVGIADNSLGAGADESTIDNNTEATSPNPLPKNESSDQFRTTVSYGVFDRQLSTPQTNFTSTVFPATSFEANGKLASARGSFFKSLVS